MTRASRRLTAHNRGILAYLTGARKEPKPGKDGSVAEAFRRGWLSARKAMEGK